MGQSFNLLIHGNPGGFDAWFNKEELETTEASYLKTFYTDSSDETQQRGPIFRIESRMGSTYYHYMFTQGVQERSGRSSKYVALSLRIGNGFCPDVAQVFALLDGFFHNKAVGTLVEATQQGYRFLVEQFADLERMFLQWELGLFQSFSAACRFCAFEGKPYATSGGQIAYFALADITDESMRSKWSALQQQQPLFFAGAIASRRLQQAQREAKAQIEDSQSKLRQRESELQSTRQSLERSREQSQSIQQQLDRKQSQLSQIQLQLQEHTEQLAATKVKLADNESKLASHLDRIKELEARLQEVQAATEEREGQISQLQQELQQERERANQYKLSLEEAQRRASAKPTAKPAPKKQAPSPIAPGETPLAPHQAQPRQAGAPTSPVFQFDIDQLKGWLPYILIIMALIILVLLFILILG